jgi:hypothetical protein
VVTLSDQVVALLTELDDAMKTRARASGGGQTA